VALMLGLEGQIALFAPVIAATSLTGWLMANGEHAERLAPWVCVPFAIWFGGWALEGVFGWRGLDHFMQVFVGTGYCGDFSCAGQWFVTAPLVGSVSYAIVVRACARTP